MICRITFVELEHRRPLQLLADAVVDVVVVVGDVELAFVEQGFVCFVVVVLDELLIREGGPGLEGVACLDDFECVYIYILRITYM